MPRVKRTNRVIARCPDRGTLVIYDCAHQPGSHVTVLQGSSKIRSATTGGGPFYRAKGRYLEFGGLSPGTYRVEVRDARNDESAELEVELAGGEVVELWANTWSHPEDRLTRSNIEDALKIDVVFDSGSHSWKTDPSAPIPLVQRSAPSRVYLMTLERALRPKTGRRRRLNGPVAVWKAHSILKQYDIPLEEMLNRESQHLATDVVLYTGMAFDFVLLHYFCASLVHRHVGGALDTIRWMRAPLSAPSRRWVPCRDVRDFIYASRDGDFGDNDQPYSWLLQSCNCHVFGNTLVDSEESTVDFYWDGMAVNIQNIGEHIERVLTDSALIAEDCPECAQWLEDLNEALFAALRRAQPTEKPEGILLQMFVPHAIVNECVYITRTVRAGGRKNGQPDADHKDCLQTLLTMQTARGPSLSHYTELQARLYLPRLMQANSGITIHEYSSVGTEVLGSLRREVDEAVARFLEHREEDLHAGLGRVE